MSRKPKEIISQINQNNQVVMYKKRLEVRSEADTVWLSQAQMARLFGKTKQNISLHINNIFN